MNNDSKLKRHNIMAKKNQDLIDEFYEDSAYLISNIIKDFRKRDQKQFGTFMMRTFPPVPPTHSSIRSMLAQRGG